MYTNAGFDMTALTAEAEERRMREAFEASMAEAERKAMLGFGGKTEGSADVVLPGSEPHLRAEFSFENLQAQDAIDARRIREARQVGKIFPDQRVNHGTHIENVYANVHALPAFAQGLFCIRCREAQPEEDHLRKEKHARLADFTGYRIPDGYTHNDCCCFCGAILKGRAA